MSTQSQTSSEKKQADTKIKKPPLFYGLVCVLILAILVLLFLIYGNLVLGGKSKGAWGGVNIETKIAYANKLVDNGLYEEATKVFQDVIDDPGLSDKKRKNLLYILGNIYSQNLEDFRSALATYIKLNEYYPENPYKNEVEQKIVEALENLGRSAEAATYMSKVTSVGKQASKPTGKTVAKIGKREIYISELNAAINALPDTIRGQYTTPEGKLKFLRTGFIPKELLYNQALRKGLDEKPEIKQKLKQLKKDFLAQQVMIEEFGSSMSVTPQEIQSFYRANKDSLYGGKEFSEVSQQVVQDLMAHKQDSLSYSLMGKLYGSEEVEIFPESLGVAKEKIEFGGK